MLDDREPEAGSSGGASSVTSVEALEETTQLFLVHSSAVVADLELARPRGERQRCTRPGVPHRVLREVLDDGLQHPPPEGKLDPGRGVDMDGNGRVLRAVGEPVPDLLEYRKDLSSAERNDLAPTLELGEEEDVVDELGHLLDLLPRLGKQLVAVSPGQGRRVEEREQPCERGPQLVRDRGRESDPKRLVRL